MVNVQQVLFYRESVYLSSTWLNKDFLKLVASSLVATRKGEVLVASPPKIDADIVCWMCS